MKCMKFWMYIFALVLLAGCVEEQEYPAYDSKKNYCGPEGKLSGPNTNPLSGASFNKACYEHDKCYALCEKTKKTQDYCDSQFRGIMDDSCDTQLNHLMNKCEEYGKWNPLRYACIAKVRAQISSCWAQASAYHNFVSYGGRAVGSYTCDDSKWA